MFFLFEGPVCPFLTAPDHGDIDCSFEDDGPATPGETCTFICGEGSSRVLHSRITCMDDGTWSGPVAICDGESKFIIIITCFHRIVA